MEECCALVDAQASAGRGLKAATVRACYRSVQAVKPGTVGYVIGKLMPEFLEALEPLFVESCEEAARTGSAAAQVFRAQMDARPTEVASALIGVTDARIHKARMTIRMAYKTARSEAEHTVLSGVPALAELLEARVSAAIVS